MLAIVGFVPSGGGMGRKVFSVPWEITLLLTSIWSAHCLISYILILIDLLERPLWVPHFLSATRIPSTVYWILRLDMGMALDMAETNKKSLKNIGGVQADPETIRMVCSSLFCPSSQWNQRIAKQPGQFDYRSEWPENDDNARTILVDSTLQDNFIKYPPISRRGGCYTGGDKKEEGIELTLAVCEAAPPLNRSGLEIAVTPSDHELESRGRTLAQRLQSELYNNMEVDVFACRLVQSRVKENGMGAYIHGRVPDLRSDGKCALTPNIRDLANST
ncbi:hypothetical protein C8J56DRAFT_890382 [Mycena floridula]|nr:hypothetical protein C8J56DRAFT_890382 [Mycena floridula]